MHKSASSETLCSGVSAFSSGSVTKRSTAEGSSISWSDDTDAHVPCQFPCTSRRRKASPRMQRNGSAIAALVTSLIFLWAIRSCIPPEVATWHRQQQQHHPRSVPAPYWDPPKNTNTTTTIEAASTNVSVATTHASKATTAAGRRRLKQATVDRGGGGIARYRDPRTTVPRRAAPLAAAYRVDPLVKPDGYPWHRWAPPRDGSYAYALNTRKFVAILARLGDGEDTLGTVTPFNYTSGGVPLLPSTIRLGPHVRPYIIRNGTVLRPGGRPGMFVTLVQRAVELAATLAEASPRLRLLAEGEVPLVFDATDYPWCGDDLVPIFRLNAIAGPCTHSWPAMSLTYFSDPSNVQLTETPGEWDAMMAEWDARYPWEEKADKIVWRGRITGYTHRDGERPRQALVQYAQRHLDVMDVKPLTPRSKMDQDDFQKFKAILDIDGNAWSSRLGKLLCFNSVVIKIKSTYVGYWEKELQPWVHYIPAEPDFSDLERTVRYALDPQNAAQVRQIIRNGQRFCRTKLTMQQYTVDLLWSLLAYAELLAGSPDFDRVWRKDRSAYWMEGQRMKQWRRPVAKARKG